MINSNWIAAWQRLSNRACRFQQVGSHPPVSIEPLKAHGPPLLQPGAGVTDAPTDAASSEGVPKAPRSERIQLAIDSLQSYELLKPIPVLIESLGDKVFVAEAPDLNVSITGNSVGAAFLLLKDHIVTLYEGYRSKKGSDPERGRQLDIFEHYIGKSRRSWF